MRIFLVTLLFLFCAQQAAALDAPTCTKETCVTDAKQLEHFVEDFYSWYYVVGSQHFAATWQEPSAQDTLKEALTPIFYAGLDEFAATQGADELVQYPDFFNNPIAKLKTIKDGNAKLLVEFLSDPPSFIGPSHSKPWKIYVLLKVWNGKWRIDNTHAVDIIPEKPKKENPRDIKKLKSLEPKPVPCSPAHCDRNPKHLEKFVQDFYRWYLFGLNKELLWYYAPRAQPVFKKSLTKEFHYSLYKIAAESNADPIINAQDIFLEWRNPLVKLIDADRNSAKIVINFSHEKQEDFKLLITLKLKNKIWLINSIDSFKDDK